MLLFCIVWTRIRSVGARRVFPGILQAISLPFR